jgi:outer membrane protein assembly factor BamA
VDETGTGFNGDLNSDGQLKENAPLITDVDRSRDRHRVEIEFTIDFMDNWRGYAGYRLRRDSFTTNDRIDVDRYHQDDTRHRVRTGVRWDFAKDWRTTLEYTYTHDNSYDGIFRQNNIMGSLRCDF